MFGKNKTSTGATGDQNKPASAQQPAPRPASSGTPAPTGNKPAPSKPLPTKPKAAPSIISTDLHIHGDIETAGDVQIEGNVTGNIRAHLLTIGEDAVVNGEINADDAVIHGTVKGKLRGIKVRLSSTARVEGDVIHKTIAIESGAVFEGSVQRAEDPLAKKDSKPASKPAPAPAADKQE